MLLNVLSEIRARLFGQRVALRDEHSFLAEAKRLGNSGLYRELGSLAHSWLERYPHHPEALHYGGMASLAAGDVGRAERLLYRAVAVRPDSATFRVNLGEVLRRSGRLEEAKSQLEQAVRLDPAHLAAHINLAVVLAAQSSRGAAIQAARRAVELAPDLAQPRILLGALLLTKSLAEEALPHLEKASVLEPDDLSASYQLERARRILCEWSNWPKSGLAIVERSANGSGDPNSADIPPFFAYEYPVSDALRLRCAQNYADRIIERASTPYSNTARALPVSGLLHVGYLSSDFHDHPTMHLAAGIFPRQDRRRFRVSAYSMGDPDGSEYATQLRRNVDHFVDVRSYSIEQLTERIRADGIHILVDMKGFTFGARPEVLARRAAPIQVQFLGYPGTMGCGLVDYLISDRIVTPPGSEVWYGEKLVLMPGSYQVNDCEQRVGAVPSRAECGLPESAFVFACFNAMYKFDPDTFDVWMRLLRNVPGSVLWLLAGKNPGAADNLRRRAQQAGVDSRRLIFAPFAPKAAHLGRLANADLILDTRYVNAHTGASDALWAGVPVLTVCGNSFPSRVAASLLHAVGLPELCTDTLQAYEHMGMLLATNPGRLESLRSALGRNRSTCSLFDTARWVRNLETAYEIMWARHRDIGEPGAFSVIRDAGRHPGSSVSLP